MTKDNYTAEVNKTATIIDTAIDAIRKYPPKEFDSSHLNQFINTYVELKSNATNPKPQYKNIKSLT